MPAAATPDQGRHAGARIGVRGGTLRGHAATIKARVARSDGSTQATYDGHPLYTYIADTAPGQANGNNLNLNGGVWHEVTASR